MVTEQMVSRGISDTRILDAFRSVPRHLFVPKGSVSDGYGDFPISIGSGQTISQPYVVAAMTEALEVCPDHVVLEIGTGSGYQAAILSCLAAHVDSIERVEVLHRRARGLLGELGYANVTCHRGDGYVGLSPAVAFDRIVVTAAAPVIPEPLVGQLADSGRLVMPLGPPHGYQELILVTKERGKVRTRSFMAVRFVPMTGKVQSASQ
jgi:protein-L-isoaspartate(D-aspartate) O-methyltransferase